MTPALESTKTKHHDPISTTPRRRNAGAADADPERCVLVVITRTDVHRPREPGERICSQTVLSRTTVVGNVTGYDDEVCCRS